MFLIFAMKFVYLKKNNIINNSQKNIFTFLLGFICFLFFLSCTNFVENDINIKENTESKPLQIDITSDEGYIFFSSNFSDSMNQNSRTIMPCNKSSDFIYYLYYKDFTKANTNGYIESINFEPLTETTGTVTHNFAKTYYEFELFALTKKMNNKMQSNFGELTRSTLQTYASLRASTFVDLRYEERTVFHLKANTLSTGKGSFEINIKNDDWLVNGDYSVTAGLYSIDDDSLVYPSSPFVLRSTQAGDSSINQVFSSFESDVEKLIQTVKTGTYNLIIKYILYDSAHTTIINTFEYSEKINILMNQTTTADFVIPDFLNKKPEAPSKLTAAYELPKSDNSEYYTVEFIWEDNSKTEQYFNLELLRTDSDASIPLITSDETWESLSVTYGGSESYDYLSSKKSIFFVDGSLSKNSASYTMKLPLGSRYVARIKAVNNAGSSSWAYITFPTNQDFENSQMVFNSDFSLFNSETSGDVTTINLHRIKYETRNGTFKALKDSTPADLPLTVFYNIQHNTTQNPLLMFYPNGSSCEYITSMKVSVDNITTINVDSLNLTFDDNSNPWQYWTKDFFTDDIPITSKSSYTYSDYKNVTFFAHYENDDYLLASNVTDKYADYYLKAEDIIIHFLKDGLFTKILTDSIVLSDLPEGTDRTIAKLGDENGLSKYFIEVSKSKVTSIHFDIYPAIIEKRHYDRAQMTVKRCKDSTIIATQTLSSENIKSTLQFGFLSKEWTANEYYIEISCHSSDFENSTFCYSLYLNLLE